MTKDEILELYNVEDYSSIKKLIENSNISEKQNIPKNPFENRE